HVDNLRFSHSDNLLGSAQAKSLRFHLDIDRDGRFADADGPRVERDEIAQVNWREEYDFPQGFRHELFWRLPPRLDAACKVDIAQDDATEDGAVSVRISRQHGYANGRKTFSFAAHFKKGLFRRS